MGQAMPDRFQFRDPLREIMRSAIRTRDDFAEQTLLKKADLAKLLSAHLFIRSALQFLGPGLVDDMRHFLFRQLPTELGFLLFDRHVPLL
jgi:hypothetical protein